MKKTWTYVVLAGMLVTLSAPANHEGNGAPVVFDGSDLHPVVTMSDKESHTLYETHDVPSTCYKDVYVGDQQECTPTTKQECGTTYHNECHTEYSNECHNEPSNECNTVYHNECRTVYKDECHTDYQQECHMVDHQDCRTSYRQECRTVNHQECHTTNQQECHTQNVCQRVPEQECITRPDGQQVCRTVYKDQCTPQQQCNNVPHQECTNNPQQECSQVPYQECSNHPQQECRNVPHQSCERVPSQECSQVPSQECHTVNRPVCEQVPHQACEQVPSQECHDVPSQECHSVPQYEKRPYDCTESETVAVGEEVDYIVNGDAHFDFSNVPAGVVANEKIRVVLEDEDIRLAVDQLSGKLLLIVKRDQSVKTVKEDGGPNSPGEKQVTAQFQVTLADAAVVSNGIGGGIRNLAITKARTLTFDLGKATSRDLLGLNLRLLRKQGAGKPNVTVFDGKIDPALNAVTATDNGSRTGIVVDLSKLKLSEAIQSDKDYVVSVKAYLDPKADLGTVLNPDLAGKGSEVKDQAVHSAK